MRMLNALPARPAAPLPHTYMERLCRAGLFIVTAWQGAANGYLSYYANVSAVAAGLAGAWRIGPSLISQNHKACGAVWAVGTL